MIGTQLDDFRILQEIGAGGMGQVYRALQLSLEREVAIKILQFSSSSSSSASQRPMERFIREARIAASIQHPNIVAIYNIGQRNNFFYIVMEYIRGNSLEQHIRRGKISEKQAWNYGLQICHGLQAALQHKIIHRDIKPANILINAEKLVKITDFGLSKKMDDGVCLTQAGMILGTPSYMSPEQASGEVADFRSDIYSLGATIYHSITGQTVFSSKSTLDVLYKHKFEPISIPESQLQSLSSGSFAILGKMLSKSQAQRYQSYGDLITDITNLLSDNQLVFANNESVYNIYKNAAVFKKSFTSTRRKRSRSRSLWTLFSAQATESKMITLVSKLRADKLQEYLGKSQPTSPTIVSVVTLSELKNHLQQIQSLVIIDASYLGPETIVFCQALKQEMPHVTVAILIDSGPTELAGPLLSLPFDNDEESLAGLLEHYLDKLTSKAAELNLATMLELAAKAGWTFAMSVNECSTDEGIIVIHQGQVAEVYQGKLKGELALRSLRLNHRSWHFDPESQKNFFSSESLAEMTQQWRQSHSYLSNLDKTEAQISHSPLDSNLQPTVTCFPPDYGDQPQRFRKLLLVEADENLAQQTVATLNNTGLFMAVSVSHAEDAIGLLNVEPFDIVVSYRRMEMIDAPLYHKIREMFPGVRQIIVNNIDKPLSTAPASNLIYMDGYTPSKLLQLMNHLP